MSRTENPGAGSPSQADEIALRDRQAAMYDQWIRENKGPYFDLLDRAAALRWLRVGRSHCVVDAGCGTGRFTTAIASRCREVWALDFSTKSLEVLAHKAASLGLTNIKTVTGDLTQADLPRGHFDRAISIAVIQHIPTAEGRLQAVRHIRESLKPGGRALFMVYRWGGALTYQKEYWSETGCGRLFRISFLGAEIRDLLRQAGFQHVRVGGLCNFPPRGVGRLPFLLKPYVHLDIALSRLPVSARWGQHLLALGS